MPIIPRFSWSCRDCKKTFEGGAWQAEKAYGQYVCVECFQGQPSAESQFLDGLVSSDPADRREERKAIGRYMYQRNAEMTPEARDLGRSRAQAARTGRSKYQRRNRGL